jgi:3-hexulose-6-phosphate synthase
MQDARVGGGNVIDFLALAGEATARAVCAVRDAFRQCDPAIPRLAFADVLIPMQGPAGSAVQAAERMLFAGVDGVGIHLQYDARRADPTIFEGSYLNDVACAVFESVGDRASMQVVVAPARALPEADIGIAVVYEYTP